MRRSTIAPGLLFLLIALPATARQPPDDGSADRRWLPEVCRRAVGLERVPAELQESPEARWNRVYRLGIEAVGTEDLEAAENHFCEALEASRAFDPRDVRFAETLDELGLVSYLKGDDETAERMQGAAVAEMLLASGPPTEDLEETAEKSCRSSVAIYMVRLGWIFDRQGREREEIDVLLDQPYRIFGGGYVPTDVLLDRLDWLIAQYLLLEDFAAADWLTALRDELRGLP